MDNDWGFDSYALDQVKVAGEDTVLFSVFLLPVWLCGTLGASVRAAFSSCSSSGDAVRSNHICYFNKHTIQLFVNYYWLVFYDAFQ